MTLLEQLKARLAVDNYVIYEVIEDANKPGVAVATIRFVMDPPNLIPANISGSASTSLTVPFVAGKTYTFTVEVVGPAAARFELFTRTAKGKTSVAKRTGPGPLKYIFAPGASTVGLFLDVKYGASWVDASVVEGGTVVVVEPPPVVVEPPPVVVEPPPVVVEPPPVVVEPPPVVVEPPPVVTTKHVVSFNMSGAEGGDVPGILGSNYVHVAPATVDFFVSEGFTDMRYPIKLRRNITTPKATSLKAAEITALTKVVDYANSVGMTPWIEWHDYAKYVGNVIGNGYFTHEDFANACVLLVTALAGRKFNLGLMNEPENEALAVFAPMYNKAIIAVRAAGFTGKISYCGRLWSGAHSWKGSGNAAYFEANPVLDPLGPNGRAYTEVHQYFDHDASGRYQDQEPVRVDVAKELGFVTDWARRTGNTLILGEWALGRTQAWTDLGYRVMDYLTANADVWAYSFYWNAGQWAKYLDANTIGMPTVKSPYTNEQLAILKAYI